MLTEERNDPERAGVRDAVIREFGFLTREHDLALTEKTWVEWALTLRYSGRRVVVELAYADDRDHYLTVAVGRCCTGAGEPGKLYGLWAWLDALGVRDRRITSAAGLYSVESIQRVARESAAVLSDYLPRIRSATADLEAAMVAQLAARKRIYDLPVEEQRTR